jgi:hypothetical protein
LLHQTDAARRQILLGAASTLAAAALHGLSTPANAQSAGPVGVSVLGPVLSQPGWSKWIQEGEIAPLREGEITLLKSIPVAPVFGEAAEARAQRVVADVRGMQPDAGPAYVVAFLAFAGLQDTSIFKRWHQDAYARHAERSEYPLQDDPYIWGRGRIPAPAAWANVEIGYAVERLQLSGVQIISFSKRTGAPNADSVVEDYLFAHYRVISVRLDGNEDNPAEGSRLAQIMFGRKDITGMLNVVSRGYSNPTDSSLMHSSVSNRDMALCTYVTDFDPVFKVLLYGIGQELDAWIEARYRGEGTAWGLASGVRPLSRTSVRAGNLSGNPRNSTHGRGMAADIILAGPGAYQVIEAGRKVWSEAIWKTALGGLAAKYGLRHLGPSIKDWPHIDIDPIAGLRDGAAAQLTRWRGTIAKLAEARSNAPAEPRLVIEPRPVNRPAKE